MKLKYEVYYSENFWWFRLVEVSNFGAVVSTRYRRRFKSSLEAKQAGRQALEHEIQKRRDFRNRMLEGQPVED